MGLGGTSLGLRLKRTHLGVAQRVLEGFEGLRWGFERVREATDNN